MQQQLEAFLFTCLLFFAAFYNGFQIYLKSAVNEYINLCADACDQSLRRFEVILNGINY